MTQADNNFSVHGSSQEDRSINRRTTFSSYDNDATELVQQNYDNSNSSSQNVSRLFSNSLSAENFVPVERTK